jgi:hypothetical protein
MLNVPIIVVKRPSSHPVGGVLLLGACRVSEDGRGGRSRKDIDRDDYSRL